jgi:hypothetical protein
MKRSVTYFIKFRTEQRLCGLEGFMKTKLSRFQGLFLVFPTERTNRTTANTDSEFAAGTLKFIFLWQFSSVHFDAPCLCIFRGGIFASYRSF